MRAAGLPLSHIPTRVTVNEAHGKLSFFSFLFFSFLSFFLSFFLRF
jgi:hypothetical protein